ncbi:molybdate ABC transporter substrate-binding protein [Dinoroseobacter sp. PD6]|uniref:molybdate ABC transporter substrate-binding protein n=1 Tax=Dinoroseobacter sp. PD6 TaxID=3028384 RepID=UPI00237C07E9|nr:molybdate ABC transporter substrate-binding protein [Dinoroseobacter sp. PD6]MDD9718067.1 molybdate ABC transporter substrate-binding protein [Dinoroseobacter sp. PD6]
MTRLWQGLCAAALLWAQPVSARDVSVFAAASLKTALEEIAADWRDETGHAATLTFAASSTIARQVDQGAPADLVLLASADWMDWLAARDLLRAGSRVALLGNTLVLIGSQAAPPLDPAPGFPLAERLGDDFLAMALVSAVPVGIYGKAALTNLGVWDTVADHVAQTDNARTALALVASGEAPLGIVYASDAQAEPRVHVIGRFPAESHPTITYPAALTVEARPEAAAFLSFLQSPEAASVFRSHGFVVHD